MTKTNDELRDSVAVELGIKSIGVELSAEDSEEILAKVATVRAFLEALRPSLCTWPDDEIPEEVFEPLSMIVAARCANIFSVPYNGGAEGMALLKRVVTAEPDSAPVQANYY